MSSEPGWVKLVGAVVLLVKSYFNQRIINELYRKQKVFLLWSRQPHIIYPLLLKEGLSIEITVKEYLVIASVYVHVVECSVMVVSSCNEGNWNTVTTKYEHDQRVFTYDILRYSTERSTSKVQVSGTAYRFVFIIPSVHFNKSWMKLFVEIRYHLLSTCKLHIHISLLGL